MHAGMGKKNRGVPGNPQEEPGEERDGVRKKDKKKPTSMTVDRGRGTHTT